MVVREGASADVLSRLFLPEEPANNGSASERSLPSEPMDRDSLLEAPHVEPIRYPSKRPSTSIVRKYAFVVLCCLAMALGLALRALPRPGPGNVISDLRSSQALWLSTGWAPVGGFGTTCVGRTDDQAIARYANFATTLLEYLSSSISMRHNGISSLGACTALCESDASCKGIGFSNETRVCETWTSEVVAGPPAINNVCLLRPEGVQTHPQSTSTNRPDTSTRDAATTFVPVPSTTPPDESWAPSIDPLTTARPLDWFVEVDGGSGRGCGQAGQTKPGPPGSGKDVIIVPWPVSSLSDCKSVCINASLCHAIEFDEVRHICQVHYNEVQSTVAKQGATCLAFRPQGVASSLCPKAWPRPAEPWCSKVGENCLETGCCEDPSLNCFAKDGFWASCKAHCEPGQVDAVGDVYQTPWSCDRIGCGSYPGRFVPPGRWWTPPDSGTSHNGARLPDVYIPGQGPHHVFIIGDWGGTLEGGNIAPAVHVEKRENQEFVPGVDDNAQFRVRDVMRGRAPASRPDYVVNVGDNFYWAGIERGCLDGAITDVGTPQFEEIYEKVYTGDGLDGRQWLGVLGNHDYGGFRFEQGWDKAIGYTWASSSGRWMTPALYYVVKVWYHNFAVDYIFMDTNVFDALDPSDPSSHNLCSAEYNPEGASCEPVGPTSVWDCPYWFKGLWERQKGWLDDSVPGMTGDWRIVVTHFPPYWGADDWVELTKKHELDLIITGHRHSQHIYVHDDFGEQIWPDDPTQLKTDFLNLTAYFVSGGGGGITSERKPEGSGEDDEYGFMDMVITKDLIKVEALSHGGQIRRVATINHEYAHKGTRVVWDSAL